MIREPSRCHGVKLAIAVDIDDEGIETPFRLRPQGEGTDIARKGSGGREGDGTARDEASACEQPEQSSPKAEHVYESQVTHIVSFDEREDICPDTAGWTSGQPAIISRMVTRANYGAGGVGLDGVKDGAMSTMGAQLEHPLLNSE